MLAALALPAFARAQEPYFDVRDRAVPAAPRAATEALERRLGPQGVVDVDPTTRTPRLIARLDGALTRPANGAATTIALRYVRENLAALGLDDLDTFTDPTVTTSGNVRQVRWRQTVEGIAAADSGLQVNVAADGRVLSVLGAPARTLPSDTTPGLTAGEAVRAVQDDVGVYRPLVKRKGVRSVDYDDGTNAELTLFAQKLAWRVTYRASSQAVYDVMVDA
jgi:Zn-dependent metalloprotease